MSARSYCPAGGPTYVLTCLGAAPGQRRRLAGGQHLGDLGCRAGRVAGVVQDLAPGPAVIPEQPAVIVGAGHAVDALGQHAGPGHEYMQGAWVGTANRGVEPLSVQCRRQPVQVIAACVITTALLHVTCLTRVSAGKVRADRPSLLSHRSAPR